MIGVRGSHKYAFALTSIASKPQAGTRSYTAGVRW
ncbi:hypothetical protein EMIT0P176_70126 [Pseudomonas sp. IT-P176]